MDRCALYSEHPELKSNLERTQSMVHENREMIQNNHIETMRMISDMSKNHSDDLKRLSSTMTETNNKFDTLNATVERTSRVFAWWDSLPCKIRMISKFLSFIVAAMCGATVIMTFFEKILGY